MVWLFTQIPIPGWDSLIQLGGMAAVAITLLTYFLSSHKDQARTVRATAITHITLQEMLLVLIYTKRHNDEKDLDDECKRLIASVDDLKKLLETQRQELQRALEK